MAAYRYVQRETTTLYKKESGSAEKFDLLWGDRVEVVQTGARTMVRARGATGWVTSSHLGTKRLLEVYFIDVGQGDGILISMPDGRHVMIDGGFPRKNQPTRKNAADFVDWKFAKDYQRKNIELDALIVSHNDSDHYGGVSDLLDVEQEADLDADGVTVEAFYHAGLSWWEGSSGKTLGRTRSVDGESFFVDLLGDRNHVQQTVRPSASPRLQGWWRQLFERVLDTKTKSGEPTPIERLSHVTGYVPGFEPGAETASLVVLAPVEFEIEDEPAIREMPGSSSKSTNGNSVLLRLDYGSARILLTGDLNTGSQQYLLQDYEGEEGEFACDVAKACHHGSDDVSYDFLRRVEAAATIISSGDGEGHDHPRPSVLAASATTGYFETEDDQLVSPLVYSTELVRSYALGHANKVTLPPAVGGHTATGDDAEATEIGYRYLSNAFNSKHGSKRLKETPVVARLIYGLVNVRTDGQKILLATRDEAGGGWHTKWLKSRF